MYYDRQGNRMSDVVQWSKLHADPEYKRVASTVIPETAIWVSTVWLGVDHSFSDSGPPVIFETMVFGGDDDETCERYCTEAEALMVHPAGRA